MFNVHALGGEAMMRAARDGASRGAADAGLDPPLVLAVTVLSSLGGEGLASPGVARMGGEGGRARRRRRFGRRRARRARGRAATRSASSFRASGRPGPNGHDQVRVLTPREAIERGADYLVVGRPITAAADPVGAARTIVRDAG